MIIKKQVFDKISKEVTDVAFEVGGILGSNDGSVITDVVIDKTKKTICTCCYEPNTDFLNKEISEWIDKDISLKGVFHTHFAGIRTLSMADKKYIAAIMNNMPEEIDKLYFPVFVLPDRELVGYKAVKTDSGVRIFPNAVKFKESLLP